MSVSLGKNGVVSASGEIGDNIIPNTSANVINYEYPASSSVDRFQVTTSIVPSASQYILSFWAKSAVAGDKVRAHYYNPNTTTTCESSQGVTKTASDGNMDFTLSTDWEFYWVKYTQTETTSAKRVIFPRMFSGYTGPVSIKCLKFEEGTVPTAWIPCSTDGDYVGNTSGFNEQSSVAQITKGYINAPDFMEI